LPGFFYYGFKFVPENRGRDVDGPDIFAAVQEELGLKLQKEKSPVKILIIESPGNSAD
jgi:uncharacterized protein (TIGR03435 family)